MLSIIIPTLNEGKYLPKVLNSIKEQNFKDYEIIIADAGSIDKTIKIAKSYGCRIIPGGLPAKGRNEGAKAAKGDLLLFLDADVILPSQFLEDFLNEFKKKKLDIASCPVIPQGNKPCTFFLEKVQDKLDKFAYGKIYKNWARLTQKFLPYATMAILAKKEVHQAIKGFDEEIKLAEDHFYARAAKKLAKAKFGFLKMGPVSFSDRRLEKDGRTKTYFKYVLAEIYMQLFGPIKTDIFKYKFNHYKDKK